MPFNYNSYLPFVTQRESGGNPNAQNPRSSASGLYQFIDSTYLPYARKVMPGQADGMLLAQKNRPDVQNKVMQAFTEENAQKLQQAGIEPTNGSVYAAHFLGPEGARKALTADPSTPITSVVSPDAIKANPSVFGGIRTVADFQKWANGGSQGPMQTAMADMPAPGAAEMSQQTGQSGFNVPPAPQSDWEQFKAGGPGALFGMPQQDWNAGDALTGAGVAMMSRDNPQGAAALAAALKYTQKDKKKDASKSVTYDKDTGKAYIADDQGNIEVRKIDDGKTKPIDAKSQGLLDGYREKADVTAETHDKFNYWRNAIANGEVDLSIANRVGTNISQYLNNTSDPKERKTAEFLADMEHMRNQKLLLNKGVQTEGDAIRAMNEIMPGASKYDNKTILGLLDRGADDLRRTHDRYTGYAGSVIKNHADGDPDGIWSKQAQDRQAGWDSWKQGYTPTRDKFLSSSPSPTSGPGTQVTGGDPAKQQREGFGSFFRRGR